MPELELSDDRDRARTGGRVIFLVGLLAGLFWIAFYAAFLWEPIVKDGPVVVVLLARALGVGVPLILIVLATGLARQGRSLRLEAEALRDEMDHLLAARSRNDPAAPKSKPGKLPEALSLQSSDQSATPHQPATPAATTAPKTTGSAEAEAVDAQAFLPLEPRQTSDIPALSAPDLIRALHFPETPEDTEGFRAMRRALRDHRAGQVVRAAQDMLTLLSQDGLYMDDLPPDLARPELWRRFASGERDPSLAVLGGIRDARSLDICAARLRENAVFRDATHHFLRRFDRLLADVSPTLSDQELMVLTDTRSARAFMLLGRAAGIFSRT